MNISRQHRIWRFAIPVVVFACMLIPAAAMADSTPGGGATADPTFNEGVVYTLPSTVIAGDVVICESTSATCDSTTSSSQYSDVLVFYNSATGPFTTDTGFDANSALVFSDGLLGSDSLATFLASISALSANAQFIYENPTGLTDYGGIYEINSPEVTPAPEPGTLLLVGGGLLGIALKTRRKKVEAEV